MVFHISVQQRTCALAALIASSTLLLAGVLALALLLFQMRAEIAHDGMSTRCVLGVCLFLAPGIVALSWTP